MNRLRRIAGVGSVILEAIRPIGSISFFWILSLRSRMTRFWIATPRHLAGLAMTRFVVVVCCLLFVVGLASPALAQVDTGLTYAADIGLTSTDVRVTVANFIRVFLGLLGMVAVGLIIYAGFLWMTAGGNEEKVTKAKQLIMNGIIGLAIILSAFAIVSFVISRLISATTGQEGGDGGGGGGFGSSANAFSVASIQPVSPTTCPANLRTCSPRNSAVRITFNAALASDPSGLGRVTVATIGRLQDENGQLLASPLLINPPVSVPGTVSRLDDGRSLLFETDGQTFDPFSQIQVRVGERSVASLDGRTLACNNGLCQHNFTVGNLLDENPPTVRLVQPTNGDFVPADSLVTLVADARDDTFVAVVSFSADDNIIGLSAPPYATNTHQASWSTNGLTLGSTHTLKAMATDVSNKESAPATVQVTIRAKHCFNGVKDADETGVDVGGRDCGKPPNDACTNNQECWPGLCINGFCKVQPVVTALLPDNGKAGNLVTVYGRGFGKFVSGKSSVNFVGAEGTTDDQLVTGPAALPQECRTSWWSDQAIFLAVPTGTVAGPVQVTNDADLSGLSSIPFVVNGMVRPGLCAVNPESASFRDPVRVVGSALGTGNASRLFFGAVASEVVSGDWTENNIETSVPNVAPGSRWITAEVAGQISNPLTNFEVKPLAGGPVISDVSPNPAPLGQYLTITGQNFGVNPGKVLFQTADAPVLSDPLPQVCGTDFWKDNQIIAKVPAALRGLVSTQVWIERSDGAVTPTVSFSIGGTPRPNICRLVPDNGPAGTVAVNFVGERFGVFGPQSKAKFFEQQDAPGLVDSTHTWQEGSAFALVPAASRTGPSVLIDNAGTLSNALQFKVGSCDPARSDACPLKGDGNRQQCCSDGSCRDSCGPPAPNQCTLSWSFTIGTGVCGSGQVATGNGCSTLQVIDDRACTLSAFQTSPSPHSANNPACTDALVFARFNSRVAPGSLNASTIKVESCAGTNCSTATPVNGLIAVVSLNEQENGFTFTSANDFTPGTIYRVTLKGGANGIKTLSGSTLDGNRNGQTEASPADDFVFNFVTRSAGSPACEVSQVSVAPASSRLSGPGQTQDYTGGLGGGSCNLLKTGGTNWSWSSSDTTKALVKLSSTNLTTAVAQGETVTGSPVEIRASARGLTGKGLLNINFLPQVMEECSLNNSCVPSSTTRLPSPSPSSAFGSGAGACTNALIHAKLTVPVNLDTVSTNSVLVKKCTGADPNYCSQTEPVAVTVSRTISEEGGYSRTLVSAKPQTGNLSPNTTYQVTLLDTITTDAGQALDGNGDGAAGGSFSWIFKTGAGVCPIGCVNVAPAETTAQSYYPVVRFKALPSSQNDLCTLVNPRSTEWQWTGSGSPPNYSGSSWTSLRHCNSDSDCDGEAGACQKSGPGAGFCYSYYGRTRPLSPTEPGKPHAIFATPTSFLNQRGEAHMIVDFSFLRVADEWPNCTESCPNAAVGLRFNQPVQSATVLQPWVTTINGQRTEIPRVQLFHCADPTCKRNDLRTISGLADLSLSQNDTVVTIGHQNPLEFGATYQVVVLGGQVPGVRAVGSRGVILDPASYNYVMYSSAADSYVWRFQVRPGVGAEECRISTVTVEPAETEVEMYERPRFGAVPRSLPDQCDPVGQRLDASKFNWQWQSSTPAVAAVNSTVSKFVEAYAVGGGQTKISAKTENVTGEAGLEVVETCETNLDCTAGPGRCSESGNSCQRDDQCGAEETCNRDSANACAGSQCVNKRCTPSVQGISPGSGAPGTWVTIQGCKFGDKPGSVVHLGGSGEADDKTAFFPRDPQCTANWTDRQIIIEVPEVRTTDLGDDAPSGPLRVVTARLDALGNPLSTISSAAFTVNDKVRPGICKLTPESGVTGTAVNIIGQNFGDRRAIGPNGASHTDDSRVSFGGLPLDSEAAVDSMIRAWVNKNIQATLPSGLSQVRDIADASVKTQVRLLGGSSGIPAGSESNEVKFYLEPFITSLTPALGPAATWVTIKGGNFGDLRGRVTFAGANNTRLDADVLPAQCPDAWSDTEIITKVPAGAVSDLIKVVTTAGIESKDGNSKPFTLDANGILAPGLCALTPASGVTGAVVELAGDRFGSARGANDQVLFTPAKSAGFTSTVQTVTLPKSVGRLIEVANPTLNVVWTAGQFGLMRSDDNGVTWTEQRPDSAIAITSFSVVSSDIAWLLSMGNVYRTLDGGRTWQKSTAVTAPQEIISVSSEVAWVRGSSGQIFVTENGGQTFTLRGAMNEPNASILSFNVSPGLSVGNTVLWMVGGPYGYIWQSRDGGATWQKKREDRTATVYLRRVATITKDTGWVVGDRGLILHTNDGGATWQNQSSGVTQIITDIFALSGEQAWAVADPGTVLATTNSGTTWNLVTFSSSETVRSVAASLPHTLWMAGGSSSSRLRTLTQGRWRETSIETQVPSGVATGDVVIKRQLAKREARRCTGVVILGNCFFGEWVEPTTDVIVTSNPKTFTVTAGGGAGSSDFQVTERVPEGANACPNGGVGFIVNQLIIHGSIKDDQVILEREVRGADGQVSWQDASDVVGTRFYLETEDPESGAVSRQVCGVAAGCPIYANCDASGICRIEEDASSGSLMCTVAQGQSSCVNNNLRVRLSGSAAAQHVDLNLTDALEPSTQYRVTIKGGPTGIRSASGLRLAGDVTWIFTTRAELCVADRIMLLPTEWRVTDKRQSGTDQGYFFAYVYNQSVGPDIPIMSDPGRYDITWQWNVGDQNMVEVMSQDSYSFGSSVWLQLKNKQGTTQVTTTATIRNATTAQISTQTLSASAPIVVMLCDNPWPGLTDFPYRDSTANCAASSGDCYDFHFSTFYCRDAGVSGVVADDLPALVTPVPVRGEGSGGALHDSVKLQKEFFLATAADPYGKQDLIGLRIYRNAMHLAIEDWYSEVVPSGTRGSPQSVVVDGYPALRDGRTIYVNGQNIERASNNARVYGTVYVFSYNDNASQNTKNIFDQLVANLVLNTNLASASINNFGLRIPSYIKPALQQDTKRLGDIQKIARRLGHCSLKPVWSCTNSATHCGASGGTCIKNIPALDSGTFKPGMSVSTWPSWQQTLAPALGGGTLPVDPINQIRNCYACLASGDFCTGPTNTAGCIQKGCSVTKDRLCTQDSDCPSGETCGADQCGLPPTLNQTACYESRTKKFKCWGGDQVYIYRKIDTGSLLLYDLKSFQDYATRGGLDWWGSSSDGLGLPLSSWRQGYGGGGSVCERYISVLQ